MGDLLGNRFIIGVDTNFNWPEKRVNDIYSELEGVSPNYFGEQRFGKRGNTHEIGKKIIMGNFEDAVMDYLTKFDEIEPEEVRYAKVQFSSNLNYKQALKEYPKYLKYERIIISHLLKNNNDYRY